MPAAVMNYAPASRHMAGQHQYTSSSGGSSSASASRGYAASSMDYAAPSSQALPSSSQGAYSSPRVGPSRLGPGAPQSSAASGSVYVVAPNGAQTVPQPEDAGRIRKPRPDTEEIKRVGRIHYQELLTFLRSHLAKGQTGPRSNAREKLTRLSKQQFTELSTDVYDELMRRLNNSRNGQEMPHLAVRDEFHPKRNQARQKLATLPKTRFKDLSSDVFFELERRFPELRDEFRPEAAAREREELEREAREAAAAADSSSTLVEEPPASSMAAQLPTSGVIIPAKSTLVSENIAVPYVQSATPPPGATAAVASPPSDQDDSGPSLDASATAARKKGRTSTYTDASRDSMGSTRDPNGNDNRSTMYSQASSVGTGFFNGYAQSRGTESVASPNLGRGEGTSTFGIEKMRSDYEFRIATLQQRVGALEAQNAELKEETEEHTMRSRSQLLEVDQHRERTRGLEEELRETKERHEAVARESEKHRELHDDAHERLQQTLSDLETLRRNHNELQQQRDARRNDDETVTQLREEMEALQSDYAHQEELVQELRGEVTGLLDELRQLSARNDEMMAEKESDLVVVRDLNNQMQSYKRKYEAAKTELRALKATSQLFVQPPKADEFVPASEKGAIVDVNLTAFQSSIDELLSAARSKAPSNVLLAMKTVVLAMTLVTDDIVKWESSGLAELSSEEREQLNMLRSKSSATLNNLMTACRNHASSHGMSPVSLLDAAASHVSATVVDFAKLLKVRKASKAETDELENTFAQGTLTNGLKPLHINAVSNASAYKEPPFSPSLNTTPVSRSSTDDRLNPNSAGDGGRFSPRTRTQTAGRYSPVGYRPDITRKNSQGEASWRDDRQRAASISSGSSQNGVASTVVPAVPIISQAIRNKALPPSRSSSTGTVSPGGNTPQSPSNQTPRTSADDLEENWAELRNYIDVQIESIVHAIQALLSAIREGATGVQLKENVEQITTIVSSIVAISKDNLPAGPRAAEGERILQALTNDCEKLSEMQSRPTFDKATKSVMASASYGMAKGLKALNALLSPLE